MRKPPDIAIAEVVADRLKTVRQELGISQTEVGIRMGLPPEVGSARISRYEKSIHPPALVALEKAAEALGVPVGYLVTRDDQLAEVIRSFALLAPKDKAKVLAVIQNALQASPAPEPPAKPPRQSPRRR
jgi:transcriptional regulator with XRE-family HTH domain